MMEELGKGCVGTDDGQTDDRGEVNGRGEQDTKMDFD